MERVRFAPRLRLQFLISDELIRHNQNIKTQTQLLFASMRSLTRSSESFFPGISVQLIFIDRKSILRFSKSGFNL